MVEKREGVRLHRSNCSIRVPERERAEEPFVEFLEDKQRRRDIAFFRDPQEDLFIVRIKVEVGEIFFLHFREW